MSFKFEMYEIVLSLKIFQISRYNKLNSNKQFISVFKYKITVIVEKLNVTRDRVYRLQRLVVLLLTSCVTIISFKHRT